jgi:hypothetical protein
MALVAQAISAQRVRSFGFAVSTLRCHYVVEVIDHQYQHALDLVIHLLDVLMTAFKPNDGRKPE